MTSVMSDFGITQQHLSTIDMDGKPCAVSVRIAYDGIEYIGRLFFADRNLNLCCRKCPSPFKPVEVLKARSQKTQVA